MNVRDVVLEALTEAGLSFRVKDGIVYVVDDNSVWSFTVPLKYEEQVRPDDVIVDRTGHRYRWSEEGQKYVEVDRRESR